ncbi:MAG: RNA-binding cell elongation regulator Jag/EloR [Clostridia bacterium]
MTIEKEAKTVDLAVEAALTELNITKEQAEIEIISNGGFLKKASVRVTKKMTNSDYALDFVTEMLNLMKLDCKAELQVEEEQDVININGEDSAVVIGYRGEVLDSLQYLTLLVSNKKVENKKRIVLNAENYREKRKETLERLSSKLAYKAYKTGRPVEIEPMNPFERRIIHTALQEDTRVTTESQGVEPNRFVVITPKNLSEDTFDNSSSYNFKRNGFGKTKSFASKKRTF